MEPNPQNRNEVASFRYSRKGGPIDVLVEWADRENVVVTVERIAGKARAISRQTWPADSAMLRKALSVLKPVKIGDKKENVFSVYRKEQPAVVLEWANAQETEDLSKVRRLLETASHLACTEATVYWKLGRILANQEEMASAINEFRQGMERLGNLYQSEDTIDDTGMKLVLAESAAKKGDLTTARNMLERILESRISQYMRLHKSKDAADRWKND